MKRLKISHDNRHLLQASRPEGAHLRASQPRRPKGRALYRVALDVEDLPVDWPNAAGLELAIKDFD
jgi:hypothetical protein